MSIIIKFTRVEDPDFSPFDLGNIDIAKNTTRFSSDEEGRHAMMLFVSISDFIHGLLSCYKGKKRVEFVGADSSFSIIFLKKDKGIQLIRKKETIECSWREIFESTISGINNAIKINESKIDWNHAVFSDLNDAKIELEKTLRELR